MAAATASAARKIAVNRKARYNYFIVETLEAGIMLTGSEVKSLRLGQGSIGEAFAGEKEGALYLLNAHIPEYRAANRFNHEPTRPRKLLVHKRELAKFLGEVRRGGMSIVPLSLYFNERGRAKVELALVRGKKTVDKRDSIKDRDWKRDQARLLRARG
ncbi:MAG: SsrA-binding protein SmpB [Alphaproteobacteria bacterium]|nr:SsrA-binding protein SmpB [Alphaproteobacteria bacterium]